MERVMPDYKEMYLKMMRASEEAVRILIQAQQECEEIYLESSERERAQLTLMLSEEKQE